MSISDRNVRFVRATTLAMALGGGVFALATPPLPNLGLRAVLFVIALANAGVVFLVFRKATPVSRLGAVALGMLCVVITQAVCVLVATLTILFLSQGLLWLAMGPLWVFESMTTSDVGLLPEVIAALLAYAAHLAVYGYPEPAEHAASTPPADRDHRFVRESTLAAVVGGALYVLAQPSLLYFGDRPRLMVIALVNAGLVFLVFRKAVPIARSSAVTLAVLCLLVTRIAVLLVASQGDLQLILFRLQTYATWGPIDVLVPEMLVASLAYAIHSATYARPEPAKPKG